MKKYGEWKAVSGESRYGEFWVGLERNGKVATTGPTLNAESRDIVLKAMTDLAFEMNAVQSICQAEEETGEGEDW